MGQFRHIDDKEYTAQVATLAKTAFLVLGPGMSARGGGGDVILEIIICEKRDNLCGKFNCQNFAIRTFLLPSSR